MYIIIMHAFLDFEANYMHINFSLYSMCSCTPFLEAVEEKLRFSLLSQARRPLISQNYILYGATSEEAKDYSALTRKV